MQCEVRAMSETKARSRALRSSDTMPKPGRVTEVCKEWVVHEDGALAYRLQKEEVEQHYTGNKSRNAIVREDFPRAREEQKKEEEEAVAAYHRMVLEQEERDAAIAKQLAQRIQREEEERRRRLEQHDSRVARHIQERELSTNKRSAVPPIHSHVHAQALPAHVQPVGDINSVGLPDVSDLPTAQFRNMCVKDDWPPPPPPPAVLTQHDDDDEGVEDLSEEEVRRRQELEDQELARLLQLQEEKRSSEGLSQLDKDRLMAIEAQDKELAKLLQDRERAKARRARERAKQRALLKKQQQEAAVGAGEEELREPHSTPSPPPLHPHDRHKSRFPDPEAIEVLPPCGSSPLPNIAMAIDPTYSPHAHSHHHHTHPGPHPDFEEYDDGPAPPYMPVQGQRRTSSLDKKKKKQSKDGCKQQ